MTEKGTWAISHRIPQTAEEALEWVLLGTPYESKGEIERQVQPRSSIRAMLGTLREISANRREADARQDATLDEFDTVLEEVRELHHKKSADYGSDQDPYENVIRSKNSGVSPWIGAQIRLGDKEKRLEEYARKGTLANESAEDSMRDNVVYNIIRLLLWRREHTPGWRLRFRKKEEAA